MKTEPQSNGPTPAETLQGGAFFNVYQRSGDPNLVVAGESIFIRQLPLKEMDRLLAAQGDEIELAKLYSGLSEDKLAELTPDSQEAIVSEGDRLNADFFARWFQRRLRRQEALVPGSTDRLLSLFAPSGPPTPAASGPLPSSPLPRVVPAG